MVQILDLVMTNGSCLIQETLRSESLRTSVHSKSLETAVKRLLLTGDYAFRGGGPLSVMLRSTVPFFDAGSCFLVPSTPSQRHQISSEINDAKKRQKGGPCQITFGYDAAQTPGMSEPVHSCHELRIEPASDLSDDFIDLKRLQKGRFLF